MNQILFIILLILCFYKPYNNLMINFFNSIFARIFIVGYIILYGKKNPQLSFGIMVCFLIITHNINKQIINHIYTQKSLENKIIEHIYDNKPNTNTFFYNELLR